MSKITRINKGMKHTLTVDSLTRAIINSVDRNGMAEEDARYNAAHILNFFGYGNRIIDNMLEQDDRNLFYFLEDTGILSTEREETSLHDGREWRIHYWRLEMDRVMELAEKEEDVEEMDEDISNLYEEIPDEVWASRPMPE